MPLCGSECAILRAAHMCDMPASRGADSTTERRRGGGMRAKSVVQRAANNRPEDINRTGMDSEREREGEERGGGEREERHK